MYVSLTDEQILLTETVADMVVRAGRVTPRAGEPVDFDAALWKAVTDAGLVAMRFGDDRAGAVEVALVAEQLARGPGAVPYVGTVLALELLDASDAHDVVDEIVQSSRGAGPVLDRGLVAPSSAGVGWDVVDGAAAIGLAGDRVQLGEAGAQLDAIDLTRRLATVDRAGDPVGRPVTSEQRVQWEAFALAVLCADLVGAMSASLEEAVEHASSREQFGRPVGSFQAVQHLCADALVLVESSRSVMWHAAWAVDALDADDALQAARVAKAYCAEAASSVCETAIQVWGGIGMTWECRAHLFLRRALLARRTLGDEAHQLSRLAEHRLGARVDAPA